MRTGRANALSEDLTPALEFDTAMRRTCHVRGYKEEGTTTTPFDMVVRNDLDRFHLVGDVIDRVPKLGHTAAYTKQYIRDRLIDHRHYITTYGQDMPDVRDWTWPEEYLAGTND